MISELRTLIAIARYGTFTAAGERIGLSQTAVSGQIKRLEEHFGIAIFDRIGRSVTLNADGRRLLERAKVLVEMFDSLAAPDEHQTAAPLRIGAIASVQSTLLTEALNFFRQDYPERRLHIRPGLSLQLFDALDAGDLDLAIVVEPSFGVPKHLGWIELLRENFVLAIPPGVCGDDWREVLQQCRFVRYDRTSYGGRVVERFLNSHGITPNESIEIDDIDAIWALVKGGHGAAILPFTKSHRPLAEGVRLVPLDQYGLQRRIGILHGDILQGPVLAFVECLQQVAKNQGLV
ncbi:LysR family transcriptional regulator [Mangrovitalea sediminis]|uniref:LysR family transcriptional regulator n=1 Tax=Mangrovitalea sediminis TaxID=1982043 RepID=UPI000BE5EB2F|nr:LysR family transcriptional regulator [Mangrovitalea sediminis]